MINKNIKRMLLFITLCILLIGIVSATDNVSNDTTESVQTISQKAVVPAVDVAEVESNVVDTNNDEINKVNTKEETKTATSAKQTKITIDPLPKVSEDESVLITGRFTDINNNPLRYTNLKVDVNGEAYYSETDDYGYYFGEYYADTAGTKTVTVSWAGNSRYAATTTKTTFNVEGQYPTQIVLNNIKDVNSSEYTTISGYYYYDNNKPLKSTSMLINIDGNRYYAKTNDKGYFSYNYKTDKLGTKTVTVSYPGNDKFKPATATKTYNVKYRGLLYTYIKLNNIKEVNLGEYTSINGYYYYDLNKPLKLTAMVVNINGNKYYAKTNNDGYFSYNYKTTKTGTNNVTVSYPGNTKFKSASLTKTFNVKNKITTTKATRITLYSIDTTQYSDYATISGYFTDSNWNDLRYTGLTISINGNKYVTRTDNYGDFTYNYRTNKVGTNTVTVSYGGNDRYLASSTTTTFTVTKKDTELYLYHTETVNKGEYTTINGEYVDSDGNPLKSTTITLNINGVKYYAKTDNYGYFYLNYKTNKVGTNKVTASYAGTSNYYGDTISATFNVLGYDSDTDGYIEGKKITYRNPYYMGTDSGLEQFGTDTDLYIKQKSTGRIAKRILDDDGVYRFYDMATGECVLG